MTIAWDDFTTSLRTGTSDPMTISHTPIGTLRGVGVLIAHGASATDHVVGVTYGGVAMTAVPNGNAVDSAGEPGRIQAYFLGSGIPTGTQTVSIDLSSGTTDDIEACVFGWTSDVGDISVIDSGKLEGDSTGGSIALLAGGKVNDVFMGAYSGVDATASLTTGSGYTGIVSQLFAGSAWVTKMGRRTTINSSDYTATWSQASDDFAAVAVMISDDTASVPFEVDAVTVSSEFQDSAHSNGSPRTVSHAPVVTNPQGVAVAWIAQSNSAPSFPSSVTYGGVAMSRCTGSVATTATSESGRVEWWFLGTGIPTGTQNVVATWSGNAADKKIMVIVTLTAPTDLAVLAQGIDPSSGTNHLDPQVTLDSGAVTALRLLALWSGRRTVDISVGSGLTSIAAVAANTDTASYQAGAQTTPSTGATTLKWSAASDDVALGGIAVGEAPPVVAGSGTRDAFGAMGIFG